MPGKAQQVFDSVGLTLDRCTVVVGGARDVSQTLENRLSAELRRVVHSHIHPHEPVARDGTAVYTLADPRDARCARYVGQTRNPRRRYLQHVREARLWLPDQVPWWICSPQLRPLYVWIRELYRDGGRLPFMWVEEWVEPDAQPL